jgi:hypothetical protein
MLGHHGGADGKAFRRCFDALTEQYGPLTALARLEASRAAAAWVRLMAATRALEAARRARPRRTKDRLTPREMERLSRRVGLEDGSYAQAVARLAALVNGREGR